jgi:hypothetical protein
MSFKHFSYVTSIIKKTMNKITYFTFEKYLLTDIILNFKTKLTEMHKH